MKGTLVGTGSQAILNLHPRLYWDARMAQQASGIDKSGGTSSQVEVFEATSQASSAQWLTMRNDKRMGFMRNGIDTTAGKNECLGSVGAFYVGTTNYFTAYTTTKYGFAVVTPTDPSQLTEDAADFPDIVRDPDIATSRYRIFLDTSIDAVNDCVIEKSQTRSATYVRTFQILVRNTDGFTTPDGVITLGWNATAGTRTTVATQFRYLGFNGWYAASILVAAGSTAGYLSIKATADTDVWEIALPLWFTSTSSLERVTRSGLSAASGTRYHYGVRTVSPDNNVALKTSGWLAMSIVLPDRSVGNGHTDNLGNANYKFLGMFNLDCDTWRLRASMSDTYDQVVINLGDTSGTNFAFLNGPVDWNDFEALGIVATWFKSNESTFAVLYVNGVKLDSVQDPATWYPQDCAAGGLMTIGTTGTIAETFISRVAYGDTRMHRSTAKMLSLHMKKLARGANPI
jgi:hypothetical protein